MEMIKDKTPKLNEALAKANATINNPSYDKENPHFRSRFASLAAVRNAVIPPYAANGLSVAQDVQTVTDGVACFTTVLHSSGEERTYGPLVITPSKRDAQGIAAAATYAKRIHLQGVACVVGDDDDDGESAVGRDTGSKDIGKPRGVTTVDPRGERTPSDPAVIAKWVANVKAILAGDVDRAAALIHAAHTELSRDSNLYIDVADELARAAVISKSEWKTMVTEGNPRKGKAA